MFRVRWIVVAAVLAAGCGGSSTPTNPGGSRNSGGVPPGGPPPNPGSHIVTGTTVNALDDAVAGVVSFTVGGTLVGRSETNGGFSVGFPSSGANRTTLTATGFIERQTTIAAPGANLSLSLIPSAFDVAAFDQMFRHSSSGLTRWKTAPGIVIERRVLRFTEVGAQTFEALEESLNQAEVDAIAADLLAGYDLLTAGRLGPVTSLTTQESAPGSSVTPRQNARIVVTRQDGLTRATGFWGYARWSTTADGEVTSGVIMLDRDFEKAPSAFHRSLRMHELGHTLGCQHVSIERASVMNSNARTEPNTFDQQAARIAMSRPTGNRTPDIDPVSHTATSAARTTHALIWHGAH
ncbi:MAG: hypothetical protein WD690_12240 [Vicinamibacterales bacterium]